MGDCRISLCHYFVRFYAAMNVLVKSKIVTTLFAPECFASFLNDQRLVPRRETGRWSLRNDPLVGEKK